MSMLPLRLSILTLNLWLNVRWNVREASVKTLLGVLNPDIFCVQELCAETQQSLDRFMPSHKRVCDGFEGWTTESNIYWNAEYLSLDEYGSEQVGIEGNRRLFWVRLRLSNLATTILVSTAHLTFKGNSIEVETGYSPRQDQTRKIIASLEALSEPNEPVFFMGDLNDTSHPIHILHEAGYRNCFSAMGLPSPVTAPTYPTSNISLDSPALSQTLDWIVSNKNARAVSAMVPNFFYGDIAPSDHWPVLAVYEPITKNPPHL